MIETDIRRNALDPGTKGIVFIKAIEPLMGTEEGFLRHVFRFGALVQDGLTDVKNAHLVACHKFAKRLGLAATGALDQVVVGGRTHG
jgi:hypothetical protein